MNAVIAQRESFETNGYLLLRAGLDAGDLKDFIEAVDAITSKSPEAKAGTRQLLRISSEILEFARTTGAELVEKILGAKVFPARGILFDKTAESNWYVTWHQDRTIPVAEKRNVEGFSAWSIKEGLQHVQPPRAVMESMVSIRIHLDDCAEDNGAIKFVPSSHLNGVIPEEEIARADYSASAVTVAAHAGDVIFMRPLILHASSKSTNPRGRRVLHIEYATQPLPNGLQWGLA